MLPPSPPVPPVFNLDQHQGLFTSGGQSLKLELQKSVLPMNVQGLISFRIDWFDLLAVQRTLKSLLQNHSWKASSAFKLLYGPTLTYVHDYWKNYSFEKMDLCRQSGISAF